MSVNEQIKKHKRIKQIQKTKDELAIALIQLLKNKKLNQLSVQEVTQKAGYARRTFYSHFDSLESVLTYHINKLTLDLFDFIRSNAHHNFSEMVKTFFTYWVNHKTFLDILDKNECLILLEKSWQRNFMYSELEKSNIKNFYYAQAFALGGMYSMLISWVKNGFQTSPQDMGHEAQEIFKHLINKK